MVKVLHAIGTANLHQLRCAGGLRQSHAQSTGALQGQVQVFLVQANAKARGKGALDHALAVHLQDARGGKAAHQGLAYLGRVSSGLAGKQQGFAHGSNIQGHNDLVGHLAGLTVAIAPDQGDVLAHELKQGSQALERGKRAAHHDGQTGGLGTYLAARDWRIQVVAALGIDLLGKVLGLHGGDGAHIDHGLARAEAGGKAGFTKQHPRHIWRVGQHHENDVGLLCNLLRAAASQAARAQQGRRNTAAAVQKNLVPGCQQMLGHGRAHDAQANKTQFMHCISPKKPKTPGAQLRGC